MKLFDIDWNDFIQRAAIWEQLTPKVRQLFAELKSNQGVKVEVFEGAVEQLVEAEFLTLYVDGKRARLHKACSEFRRAIRAMYRIDVLGQADPQSFTGYVSEHFTAIQQDALASDSRDYYGRRSYLIRQATTAQWLDGFLSARQGVAWEEPRLEAHYRRAWEPLFDRTGVFKATKTLVRALMDSPEPVPFTELPARLKLPRGTLLGEAILAAIRYLLVYPTLRPDDGVPVLTIWPTIHQRLHRPKPVKPKPVAPQQTHHSAFLMEDVTTLLVAAAARPLRLRGNDGELFAKAQKELAADLTPLPDWLLDISSYSSTDRLNDATYAAKGMSLVEATGEPGSSLALEATEAGREWLALGGKDRLKAILDHLRPSPPKPPARKRRRARYDDDYYYEDEYYAYSMGFSLLPSPLPIRTEGDWDPAVALTEAFAALPGDDFVTVRDFLQWQTCEANPLLSPEKGGTSTKISLNWSWHTPTEEELEALWESALLAFMASRLTPLGGLRVGLLDPPGDTCIALTDIGRYLLGLADDFDYGHQHDARSQILVQPNFDVVFLGPSPAAEAEIARFSQRQGKGMGAMFKLTKKSIFAAAAAGLTAEGVLDVLTDVSAKDVPDNVAREIRGWFGQCRRITIEPAVVVRCPDPHTAARVVAAGGKHARPITETMIELTGVKNQTALIRKLDAEGIFATAPPAPAKKKRRAKRSRRRRW